MLKAWNPTTWKSDKCLGLDNQSYTRGQPASQPPRASIPLKKVAGLVRLLEQSFPLSLSPSLSLSLSLSLSPSLFLFLHLIPSLWTSPHPYFHVRVRRRGAWLGNDKLLRAIFALGFGGATLEFRTTSCCVLLRALVITSLLLLTSYVDYLWWFCDADFLLSLIPC